METEVKSLSVSLSEAVKYAKITNLADIIFKQAKQQKDQATMLNPTLQAYQDICNNTAYQSLVDKDFFTTYNLLYNIQMNDIILQGAGLDLVYYGFIAQNKTTKEYVVAIRGTENILEVIADSFFVPTAFKEFNNNAVVPAGFYELYESGLVVSPSDSPLQVVPLLLTFLAANPTALMPDVTKARTVVSGHSLGASLATYFAAALAVGNSQGMNLCVYTYASPISGNAAFADTYNDSVKENYRIHNLPDGVPSLPKFPLNGPNIYVQVAGGYQIDSSQYTQVKPGAGCAHQLPVYQYTLDRLNGIDNPDILNFDLGNCKA